MSAVRQRPTSVIARLDPRHNQSLIVLLALIVLWQVVVVVFQYDPIALPSPVRVLGELGTVAANGQLLDALRQTLTPLAQGLVVSAIVGGTLGLLFGSLHLLGLLTRPYLWALFALPRVALLPIFVLWFGVGLEIKFWLVVASASIPLIIAVMDGMQTVDTSLVRAARSFGAKRWVVVRKVAVPSTIPFIANGLRQSISRGFVAIIVAEMVVSTGGVGTEAMRATTGSLNTARMLAYTVVMIALGVLLIQVSQRAERYASRWRQAGHV